MIQFLIICSIIFALTESAVVENRIGEPETRYSLVDLKVKFNAIRRQLDEIDYVIKSAPRVEINENATASRCKQTCPLWDKAKLRWSNAVALADRAVEQLELVEGTIGKSTSEVNKTFSQASMLALKALEPNVQAIKEVVDFVADFYTVVDFDFYVICLNDAVGKFESKEMDLISAIDRLHLQFAGDIS